MQLSFTISVTVEGVLGLSKGEENGEIEKNSVFS